MRNNKMKGFTLVELLVVIAILAILATVSVVGYTSYIEGATVRVDEDLATQLNHKLAAYRVDFREDITVDNIQEVTAAILNESGITELNPKSADYGYHFYYNLETEQYVLLHNDVAIDDESVLDKLIRFTLSVFAEETQEPETPKYKITIGNCFTKEEGKYFLVDTEGDLADVIKGYNSLEEFEGTTAAEKFATFLSKVTNVDVEPITTLVNETVFVTADGNFVASLTDTHNKITFVEGATFLGNTLKDTDSATDDVILGGENYLLTLTENTTIEIPAGIKLPANSLNIANEGQLATVVINAKSWNEVVDIVDAYFTDDKVVVELAGVKYEIYGNDVCTYTADETKGEVVYVLKYNNSLQDFDIEILDKDDNQLLNGTKLVGEETIKAGFADWGKGSFKLQLANATGKNDSAISSLDVEWKVISGPATIAQDGTLTFTGNYDLSYDKVVVSATSIIDRNGYTSASDKFDAENVAYNEYVIYIAGPQGYTVEIDNRGAYAPVDATLTNRTYNIGLAKEAAAGNTYNFKLTVANNENVIDGVAVNYSNIAVTFTCSEHGTSCENVIVTSNSINVKGACSGVITVKVGNYFTYTVNLTTVDVSNLPVVKKNDGIVLGNLNEVIMSDLFKPATGDTFPAGAELKVFQNKTNEDSYAIPVRTAMPTSNANGVTSWVTYNADGSISFNGTRTADVYVAVFQNGQRISPDVQITDVVEAYNINDYADIATAETNSKSMVLLNNITVATNTSADEVITVKGGKTLYGNYYTINLPAPVAGSFSRDYSYIRLEGATMLNTKVVGTIYDSLSLSAQANDGKGKNAVLALSGSTIENCYIANTRSPLVSGSASDTATNKVIVKNSVLFGGRYCNVDLRGGTLEFQGDVITVNQPYEGVVGTGINVWLKAPTDTNVVIAEGATWTPYNFIEKEEASILPEHFEVETTKGGYDIAVGLPLNKMFMSIFGECARNHAHVGESGYNKYTSPCCSNVLHEITGSVGSKDISSIIRLIHFTGHKVESKYDDYIFAPVGTTEKYVNAAIVSLNDTTVLPTATTQTGTFVSTTYSIDMSLVKFNIGVGTLDPTVEANKTLLTNSANAVATYNPNAYGFVGGDLASLASN